MTLMFTNTLTRRIEAFVPADPARVTLYVCGPTVYNYAHLGNARPAVVFDVLYRLLKSRFHRVVYARNFTDVDDKINAAARAADVPIAAISSRFIDAYRQDMAALGVLTPDLEPRVTEHVPEIVSMIERLLLRGNAYVAEGHVLFHVPSFPRYGALSGRGVDEMIAGARVEVAPYKKHPADFVLWKPSTEDLPGWSSPWGRGRPGWHIECSAMIEQGLGETVDIHGGGQDLIFPHHENEIAQGTCAHDGKPYCGLWMHNGFVTVEGRKMSKSLGNVLLVNDLLREAGGEAIRLALLSAHYRQPLDWSSTTLRQAERTLDRLYGALAHLDDVAPVDTGPDYTAIEAALAHDLNTPAALAVLYTLARESRGAPTARKSEIKGALLHGGALLGILGQAPARSLEMEPREPLDRGWIDVQLQRRNAARAGRNFAEADRIRRDLEQRGLTIEDRPDGTVWSSGR
jgi:cysteinyl-tRNA synthetase